jgi:prepilin-type N-terminal cleavage/methylation domain-containing protein
MKGFSLIEIILGLGLFAVLMVAVNVTLVSTLRDSRKASAVAIVKQEGGLALSLMEKAIKVGQSVTCLSATEVSLVQADNSVLNFTLDTVNHRLTSTTGLLTGSNVTVSADPSCAAVFSCSASSVNICFNVETATGVGTSDKAGLTGIKFQTLVSLLNTSL